jgi:hypothetical protein
LAVGFVAGLGTGAVATHVNENYFSESARDFRRWQAEMDHLESIYIQTGVLSRGDISDSKSHLRYSRVGSASDYGYAKEAWLRPDGSVAIERIRPGDKWEPERYFTPDGKEFKPQ